MPLIDRNGQVIEDPWTYSGDGGDHIRPYLVVSIGTLASAEGGSLVVRPLGALVAPDTPIETIEPLLSKLDMIVVEFPKFRDGRGFTIGRTLRGRLGYRGDIRAIGHVLPDQFAFLLQCGFSTIVTPPEHPPEHWTQQSAVLKPASEKPVQLLNRLINRTVTTR